jgi:hypothetical protein
VTPTPGFTPGTLVSLNNADNMPSGSPQNSPKPPIQNTDNNENRKRDPEKEQSATTGLQEPKTRCTDKAANMQDVFKNYPVGKMLEKLLEKTKHHAQGQKVWRAIKNIVEYGIKAGDYLYLDNLHKDHIEVFGSTGKMLLKTVLNLDGSINAEKVANAIGRSIRQYIR